MQTQLYPPEFFNETYLHGTRASAAEIVEALWPTVQPSSAVDVGCGVGVFLAALAAKGVKDLCGVDGEWIAPEQLLVPRELFVRHDLREPFRLGRRFDLALCMEVAEHLPPAAAAPLVESLCLLAPIVLFSAAIPLQGGVGHLNEQWPEYWVRLFAARGYVVLDCIRSRIWESDKVFWWYAQNTLLFVEGSLLRADARLSRLSVEVANRPLAMVHPKAFLVYRTREAGGSSWEPSLRDVLSFAKRWAVRQWRRGVKRIAPA